MNFNYHLPVNLAFGRGRFSELGETVTRYGRRVLLVISRGSAAR